MHFYCIRHSETEANLAKVKGVADTRLTEHGRTQTINFAKQLLTNQMSFSVIVTSPLTRALEAAQILGNIIKTPVEVHNSMYQIQQAFRRFVALNYTYPDYTPIQRRS